MALVMLLALWLAGLFFSLQYQGRRFWLFAGEGCFNCQIHRDGDYQFREFEGWKCEGGLWDMIVGRFQIGDFAGLFVYSCGFRLPAIEKDATPPLLTYDVAIPYWLLCLLAAAPWIWFRHRVRKCGVADCRSCGYNLTRNVSGVCPECGTPVPEELKRMLNKEMEANRLAVPGAAPNADQPPIGSEDGSAEKRADD